MGNQLVVVRAFGAHAVGDRITESAAMDAVLASENAQRVVRVPPPPAAPAAPTAKEG